MTSRYDISRFRPLSTWIWLLALLLTPTSIQAGHGFFSPTAGTAGLGPWIETSDADGTAWALSGGALYRSQDEGRSWRLENQNALGNLLWIDPNDSSTIVTWREFFSLSDISVSLDGGETFARRDLPAIRLRDFTPTTGPWYALFQDQNFGAFPYRSFDRGETW